jgi:hypothetical protein
MLPIGFVVSKNRRHFVVIRGTQTPLEWLDDGSTTKACPVSIASTMAETPHCSGVVFPVQSTVYSALKTCRLYLGNYSAPDTKRGRNEM